MTFDSLSVSSTTFALSGPTSVTRPASAPPAATTTSPTAIPSSRCPCRGRRARRNSDDSRAMTAAADGLVVEPGAELQERRQRLVLATDLVEPGVLRGEPLVLGAERAVVGAQAVDLGDRRDDRRDRRRRPVEGALDRPEGEADPVLDARARPGWTRRP